MLADALESVLSNEVSITDNETADELENLLSNEVSITGKAMKVLLHYQDQIELGMGRPQWGSELLVNLYPVNAQNGLLLDSSETNIPVPQMFLLLLGPEFEYELNHTVLWEKVRKVWHEHKLSPNVVLGIRCNTVASKIKELHAGKKIVLKSCLFPILKAIEEKHQICVQCGKQGHIEVECHRKFCTKCGRSGHLGAECFAKKDLNWKQIQF
jgi:hypothetical protein